MKEYVYNAQKDFISIKMVFAAKSKPSVRCLTLIKEYVRNVMKDIESSMANV